MNKSEKLGVTIWNYSSYSPPYEPDNILQDKAHDQTSRWSSDSNVPPQFITLKIEKPAIVQRITFGKYEKSHVCNLKKFRILGGMVEEKMIVLLESGLKNDSRQETFTLRHEVDGHCFPCRFLQILPIQSWGPSFNFSIWYVELNGIIDWNVVKPCLDWYSTYRERLAVRLCLKHLRQLGCLDAFEALKKKKNIRLEDPRLTELHDVLVLRGDFVETERVLERAMDDGLFGPFISSQEYVPQWTRIAEQAELNFPGISDNPRPGMRGGHQMCIDATTETIYLFGGWDGAQDLNDLWSYYIPNGEWTLVSSNTTNEGGPTPRSCHKMCLDSENRQIFVLGRYLDTQNRSPENLKSDFYVYDIDNNQWTLISEDTALVGGPKLVFDHQMCLDPLKKIIYVFGGRILTPSGTYTSTEAAMLNSTTYTIEHRFSGLYSYHVPTSTWKKLKDDPGQNAQAHEMKSRIGHSMLFHPTYRKLYIFAGQRHKEYMNDFFTYHVDTGEIDVIADGTRQDTNQVPAAGFTQRSTIDPYRDEIHVLSGLSKEKEKRDGDGVKNSFWVYDIKHNRWTCIYKNDRSDRDIFVQSLPATPGTANQQGKGFQEQPCPRYAHQLVYDTTHRVHYLFGGNPGNASDPKMRLDDFWSLRLCRVSQSDIMRRCRFLVRKCRFQEMAGQDILMALRYIQTAILEVVDQANEVQVQEFHSLASFLFRNPVHDGSDIYGTTLCRTDDASKRQGRYELYSSLVDFFPDYMTQPKANLVDLIPLDNL